MLDKYFESAFALQQLRNGPSGPWLDRFARSLHGDGYSWWTARSYLRAAHHLGHFLQSKDIALVAMQPDTIAFFRRHLQHCRCPKPRGRKTDTFRGAKCFLRHLWNAGVVTRPPKQPWPPLVQGFRDWLKNHRGASETTLSRYSAAASELLKELGSDPGQYDAQRLRDFLLGRARRRGVGGTKAVSSALRMFLRYLASQGQCRSGLDAALPAIAGWRLASLPRCLSTDEVERLLASCDAASPMGLRDRAVILLLARLGLRASDVGALRLADIDWGDGSILVKGKSRRPVRLPLPQDVGDALLAYLQHRLRVQDEHIFFAAWPHFEGC